MNTQVKKNQIWQDNHVNRRDRKFKVEAVLEDQVLVKSVSGTSKPKLTKININGFVPRYYSLVSSPVNISTTTSSKDFTSKVQFNSQNPFLTGSPVGESWLLRACRTRAPNMTWVQDSLDVVKGSHGEFKVVVNNYENDSYSFKLLISEVLVDNWVTNHLDFETVFRAFQDKVREITNSMTEFL